MAKVRKKLELGVRLKPTNLGTNPHSADGEISVDSTDNKLKARLNSSDRSVVTEDQSQTLTNKTINVDNNTVSNIETDNLKSGVLNTSTTLSGATDTQIPSALAVKTYIDDGLAAQDDASEISSTPSGNLVATNVQDALNELQSDIDTRALASDLTNHLNDTADAHDASAISNVPSGNLVATNVQDALDELQTELDGKVSATQLNDHINDVTDAHDASAISNVPSGNLAATDIQAAVNELQSDIDTRATSTDLTNHINDTSTHGVTGDVVGTTDSQTLTNKTITGASIQDPTRLDVKKDTYANLETYATTATNGQLCFATDSKKMYQVVDNALVSVGSGSGGINYISNPDAEVNTADWSTYADAAGANAVDGTGGSPNITFTRNTTNPLRDSADFLLTKDAANRQGEGVSIPFTIDKADNSKKLYISFDFLTSANYADNDIRVQVYDVTNSILIRCNAEDLKGSNGSHLAWFQADATSTSYRLILHVSSTNASAYTVNLDNVKVGPRDVSYSNNIIRLASGAGNAGTSLTASVTNIDFSTTYSLNNSFNGTTFTAPAEGLYFVTGNVRFTAAIDAIINFYVNGTVQYGLAGNVGSVQSLAISGSIYLNKGDALTLRSNTSATLQNNTQLHNILISGPSLSVISEDIGNREIRVRGAGNGGTALTANITDITFTEVEDTTASWDGSVFTAPETGNYVIDGSVNFTPNSTGTVYAYVDGSQSITMGHYNSSSAFFPFKGILKLNKGQTFSVRLNISTTLENTTAEHYINIQKLAMPQTVLETETVAARYTSNSGQAIDADQDLVFEDKVHDTHGAYNTSTGVYTVPVQGFYSIDSKIETVSFAASSGERPINLNIKVNGTVVDTGARADNGNAAITKAYGVSVSAIMYLNKGDLVIINETNSLTGGSTLNTTSAKNTFSIARIK